MNKFVYVVLFVLTTLFSCHKPQYSRNGDIKGSLDLRKGEWLLNTINAPINHQNNLTRLAKSEFSKLLSYRFKTLDNNSIELENIIFEDNPSVLKAIHKSLKIDYLINIKSNVLSDDIEDIKIGTSLKRLKNQVKVSLDIYNLNTATKIYSQEIDAKLTIGAHDNKDLTFVLSTKKLSVKALKKILRNLKKYAIID